MKLPFVSRKALEASEARLAELNLEYQNYRRRNGEIRETAHRQGENDAIQELLSVYDNLLLALEQPCEDEAFRKGIEMTLSTMVKSLAALGVTEIPALGKPFDPKLHEAMDHVEDESFGENTVSKVIRTGFQQNETVLRHSLVIVAN